MPTPVSHIAANGLVLDYMPDSIIPKDYVFPSIFPKDSEGKTIFPSVEEMHLELIDHTAHKEYKIEYDPAILPHDIVPPAEEPKLSYWSRNKWYIIGGLLLTHYLWKKMKR